MTGVLYLKQTEVKVMVIPVHVNAMSNEKMFHSKLKPIFKTTSKFKSFLISLILTL